MGLSDAPAEPVNILDRRSYGVHVWCARQQNSSSAASAQETPLLQQGEPAAAAGTERSALQIPFACLDVCFEWMLSVSSPGRSICSLFVASVALSLVPLARRRQSLPLGRNRERRVDALKPCRYQIACGGSERTHCQQHTGQRPSSGKPEHGSLPARSVAASQGSSPASSAAKVQSVPAACRLAAGEFRIRRTPCISLHWSVCSRALRNNSLAALLAVCFASRLQSLQDSRVLLLLLHIVAVIAQKSSSVPKQSELLLC
jgi:hypothetical protein